MKAISSQAVSGAPVVFCETCRMSSKTCASTIDLHFDTQDVMIANIFLPQPSKVGFSRPPVSVQLRGLWLHT